MSFTFNGIKKDYLRVLAGLERPAWAPIEEEIIEIPGAAGGIITGEKKKIRRINVPIRVYKKGFVSLEDVEEDLAVWLIVDEPKPLIFPHKPNRIYYAKVTRELILNEYPQWGEGVISFICLDPYKYGPENTIPVTENTIFRNEGTTETFATFRATINQPTTFLSIVTPDDYMMVGSPVDVEEIEFVKEQTLLKDSLTNTVGWTNGTTVLNGQVAGTMISDGNEFVASDYGTGSGWHGPALKKSFSETLQDFRFEGYLLQSSQDSSRVGRVEFYLLDENNAVVARLGMRDSKTGIELNQGYISVHNGSNQKYIIYEEGNNPGVWNDFRGVLRLQRVGNTFTAYIAKQAADGSHYARRTIRFEDTEGKYLQRVAQVEIHIAAHGSSQTPDQQVREVRMYKINNPLEQQIPYIAEAGDIIEFNHVEGNITKNGEPFLYEKDFASNYFALGKGETEIKVLPEGVATVEMIYRPRWL